MLDILETQTYIENEYGRRYSVVWLRRKLKPEGYAGQGRKALYSAKQIDNLWHDTLKNARAGRPAKEKQS